MKENRSVSRILAILELIAKHDEGLTLGQIYRILEIPKATVYDFLQTLYYLIVWSHRRRLWQNVI